MGKIKKWICRGVALAMLLSLLPLRAQNVKAEETSDETPAKLLIAAVYGGGVSEKGKTAKKGSVSHSFIEIYNPNEEAVSLKGYTLHYQGYPTQQAERREGENWASLPLDEKVELPGFCSYLINAGETAAGSKAALQLSDFDQVWENAPDMVTKGAKYLLTYDVDAVPASLVNPFDTDGSGSKLEGYVDMLGTAGNDVGENDEIDGSEGSYPGGESGSSKQKGFVRKARGTDTDDNAADFQVVDFREESDPLLLPRSLKDGPLQKPEKPESSDETEPAETTATQPEKEPEESKEPDVPEEPESNIPPLPGQEPGKVLNYLCSYSVGASHPDGGIAEIVQYNPENQKMYVVSGARQCVDIVDLSDVENGNTELYKRVDMWEIAMQQGFSIGDITSAAVNTEANLIAVCVQNEDFRENGSIVFLDYDGNYLYHVSAGCQPDMIGCTPDGRRILTANEGEPRNGYGDVDPEGSVTIVDLASVLEGGKITNLPASAVTNVGFGDFDSVTLDPYVLTKKGSLPSQDFEPEYITFSADSKNAYVSLQENNAIAVLDLDSETFTAVHGIQFKDHSLAKNALDLNKNGAINIVPEENVLGVPMPDGIAAFESGGRTYILTANEGDAREWGDYANIGKKKINGSEKKVEYLLPEETPALPSDKTCILGGRSFSILDASKGMKTLYDSGSDFETVTAHYMPSIFNANHKSNALEGRSNKKGPEPEDVKVLDYDGRSYAFISLERVGGVMMYDITDPASSFFVDYFNNRDPEEDSVLAGDLGAEGIATVEAAVSPNRKPMVLVANEVSGTVTILDFGEALPPDVTEPTASTEAAGEETTKTEASEESTSSKPAVTTPSATPAPSETAAAAAGETSVTAEASSTQAEVSKTGESMISVISGIFLISCGSALLVLRLRRRKESR